MLVQKIKPRSNVKKALELYFGYLRMFPEDVRIYKEPPKLGNFADTAYFAGIFVSNCGAALRKMGSFAPNSS